MSKYRVTPSNNDVYKRSRPFQVQESDGSGGWIDLGAFRTQEDANAFIGRMTDDVDARTGANVDRR